jgi:hypothetical protein
MSVGLIHGMFGGGAKNGVGVIVAVRVGVAGRGVRVGPGVRVGGMGTVAVGNTVCVRVAVGVGVGVMGKEEHTSIVKVEPAESGVAPNTIYGAATSCT